MTSTPAPSKPAPSTPVASTPAPSKRGPWSPVRSTALQWGRLGLLLLGLLIVPFLLWEDDINALTAQFLASDPPRGLLSVVIIALMAADVLLPVPSSVVATAAGALLGVGFGTLSATAGMCLGCAIAYGLGTSASPALARYLLNESQLARARAVFERSGPWVIAVCRPVPVLAEISVIFAGMARMPKGSFALYSSAANLGIAACYAYLGAQAAEQGQMLYAWLGSLALPGRFLLLARVLRA